MGRLFFGQRGRNVTPSWSAALRIASQLGESACSFHAEPSVVPEVPVSAPLQRGPSGSELRWKMPGFVFDTARFSPQVSYICNRIEEARRQRRGRPPQMRRFSCCIWASQPSSYTACLDWK